MSCRLLRNIATDWEKIHEKNVGDRILLESDRFRYCYFEPHGKLICAIQEMLLQSDHGVILVFPAIPQNYSASFELKTEGGHKIISQMQEGEIRFIGLQVAVDGLI